MFFLWLKEGDASNQKNMSITALSSRYFNITDDPVSSSTRPSSTATFSSSLSPPTQLPTASTVPTAASAGNQAPSETETPATNPATGLPVAAQAGIGVGVSIFGLVCIFCAVLWFRYLKKKQRLLEGAQQNPLPHQAPGLDGGPWKMPVAPPVQEYHYRAEMDTSPYRAEMDTVPYLVEMPTHHGAGSGRPAELGYH